MTKTQMTTKTAVQYNSSGAAAGFTPQALQHASNNSSLIELWDNTRFIQELKDHSLNIY